MMDYSIIIYFLTIFIRITITFEYNTNNNDDDDDEKLVASQSCKYYIIFYCPTTSFHLINNIK